MTLHQKQVMFSNLFAKLVLAAENYGYSPVIDTVTRSGDPRCHGMRLAGDILLFHGNTYLTDGLSEPYKKLGDLWKSYHPLCRWGGDFKGQNAGDGNHFSITHNGKS